MEEEFIEECWFIYGVRIKNFFFGYLKYHNAGSSDYVEFDWKQAMNPLLIGWVHTHPSEFGVYPSGTDNTTMRGWVRGKNKSMVCGIVCDEKEGWYDYFRQPDSKVDRRLIKIRKKGQLIICFK